ncbi:MAG: hypothetical protein ACR2ML_05230 [Solirubrobacteraceae bacterium]
MPTSARISLRGPIARLVAGAMLALVLALGHSAAARADDPPQPPLSAADWTKLASDMARPWPGLQRTNGSYRDYLKQSTRYGDATLGYALLQHGILTKDRRLINSGLDGITYAIRRTGSLVSIESVFENMAVAGAYNLARNNLRGDKRFGRVNGAWARYLRRARATKVEKRDSYGNHYLPEAIAVLELMRSGLKSPDRRAIVGGGRARVRRAAIDLIVRRIPGMARREDWNLLGGRAFVLSDPPSRPPAYQGLSAGLYARALALLPGRPPAAARDALQRIVHATWGMTGPDGDLGFFGRSQELSWSLSYAAFAAEEAVSLPGSGAEEDARWQALSDRMIGRLRDAYGVGPNGLYVLPALRDFKGGFFRGRDGYVGATSFNGLTLLALDWGAETIGNRERRPGQLLADRDGQRLVSYGEGRYAVVRRGPLWWAIKQTTSPAFRHKPEDLRSDTGVVALKELREGRWRDLMPIRPRTDGTVVQSTGPILLRDGRRGLPTGTRLRVRGDGVVTNSMDFRTLTGPPRRRKTGYLRRSQRFVYRPLSCGVETRFPVRRGDRFEYSAILRRRQFGAKNTATEIFNDELRYEIGGGLRIAGVKYEGGYASGSDVSLVRGRAQLRATRSGTATITVCRPSGGPEAQATGRIVGQAPATAASADSPPPAIDFDSP